jgi:hypothetical protein
MIREESYGKLIMRLPRRVQAKIYLPYSNLPHVRDIIQEMSPPLNSGNPLENYDITKMGGDLFKGVAVCTHGEIDFGNGRVEKIMPREYILYHETRKVPVGKISEDEYLTEFCEPDNFCAECEAKLQETFQQHLQAMAEKATQESSIKAAMRVQDESKILEREQKLLQTYNAMIATLRQGKQVQIGNKLINNEEELKTFMGK